MNKRAGRRVSEEEMKGRELVPIVTCSCVSLDEVGGDMKVEGETETCVVV